MKVLMGVAHILAHILWLTVQLTVLAPKYTLSTTEREKECKKKVLMVLAHEGKHIYITLIYLIFFPFENKLK